MDHRIREILKARGVSSAMSSEEWLQHKVDLYNAKDGELTGYDCPKCLNKGHRLEVRNGSETYIECSCLEIRRNLRLIEESGIKNMMDDYTFDHFEVSTDWQRHMFDRAKAYAADPTGWFFAGGQVGSGKSHICTAIVGELLNKGIATKYCLWREESTRLKGLVNEDEYDGEIKKYKTIPCLYIDDFFKVKQGAQVTPADVNLAFEILNYRYNNRMLTVISSEKTISEIMEIDEATGSRIYQMSADYLLNIGIDKNKNYRMRRRNK
jgi:DNA replication protein DnaC